MILDFLGRSWRYSPACSLGARNCDGCAAANKAVLRTVVHHGEADDALRTVNDSLPLCAACSLDSDRRYNAEWPEIERVDVIALWAHVNTERHREAQQQVDRERAVSVTLDELQQALFAALKQAQVNQTLHHAEQVA